MTKTLFTPPMKYFSNVNRYTRAGKNGKQILCPECKESIDKYDWVVESKGA